MPTADAPPPGTAPVDAMAALKAQLAAQAQDNPGLAVLLQLMDQRPAPRVEDDVVDVEATCTTDAPVLDENMRADLQTLVQGNAQLNTEIEALRQRNDALAAALGACHLCFGEDAWCPHCAGRGKPGSRRPEPRVFNYYVRPLLTRLQPNAAASADVPTTDLRRVPSPSPDSTEGLRAGAARA